MAIVLFRAGFRCGLKTNWWENRIWSKHKPKIDESIQRAQEMEGVVQAITGSDKPFLHTRKSAAPAPREEGSQCCVLKLHLQQKKNLSWQIRIPHFFSTETKPPLILPTLPFITGTVIDQPLTWKQKEVKKV